MAFFGHLPPELQRLTIEHAVLARDRDIPPVARLEILRRLAGKTRVIPWYVTPWDPPRTGEEPAVASETLFLARYLLGRPHAAQDRWDANLSAYLNTLLDLVLAAEGLSIDDGRRPQYMMCLCRYYMGVRLAQAVKRIPGWSGELTAAMYSVFDLFGRPHFTFASGPLEHHLLACQSVLDASAGA
ncbi:hypothetical protein PG993_010569 [Apiospora rasikravindrae]|uniref:Uncharacterized protein n=1 Tax=Apiospora rasikravindrae TaxID=990691 RepID=A0ABR1SMP5_9PEZI